MARPKVFVSYSHRDDRILRSLLPYLESLRRQRIAEIWVDTELKGGDRWRDEIDAALDEASVAVLLISQSFLVSRFIYEEELPRIFRRQRDGKLAVLPVFLSPSTVTSTSIPFADTDGIERRVILSDFQGFGTPERTIRELAPSERDRKFVTLHDRIKELATDTQPISGTLGDSTLPTRVVLARGADDHSGTGATKFSENVLSVADAISTRSSSGHSASAPPAVILDRHYAYTLTSYSNDSAQQHSAQLLQKYDELFDVLTCSIMLFDEIYLEQHHVSSMDSLLNDREASAFSDLFTPFSLAEPVGSTYENTAVEDMIKSDLEDPNLRQLVGSYYGRRPMRPENSKELVIYVNRTLQHAQALDAAIFSRPNRMPLFRHKFLPHDPAEVDGPAGISQLTTMSIQMPARRSRTLDEIAALQLEPTRKAFRARVWEQVHERVKAAGQPGFSGAIDAQDLLASRPEFSRKMEVAITRLPLAIGVHDWHFLVIDN